MWDIDQLYNDCYVLYERNLDNEEIKEKIEKVLYDIDAMYLHTQNEIWKKFLEIKEILDTNQKENGTR